MTRLLVVCSVGWFLIGSYVNNGSEMIAAGLFGIAAAISRIADRK